MPPISTIIKQKKVFKEVVENGSSLKSAIKKAGYSDAVATAPSKITRSKTWQALMKEYLPDEKVTKVHSEALEAVKLVTSPTEEDRFVPDYSVRLKAVDIAYKLKGKYPIGQQLEGGEASFHVHLHGVENQTVLPVEVVETQQ